MADLQHRVYFLTNRNKRGRGYGDEPERNNALFRVGHANAVRKGDGFRKYTIKQSEYHTAEEDHDNNQRGSDVIFAELRDRMRDEKRDLVIFLHGFNSTFKDSLRAAAQLRDRYRIDRPDTDPVPLALAVSWPSEGLLGPIWPYFEDRRDARQSGMAIARGLRRLIEFLAEQATARITPCEQRLHLVAHSMGNWALRHAVQVFREHDEPLPRLFDTVFLMAADEDEDALGDWNKLRPLTRLSKAVHVYHARNDTALTISDDTKSQPDRLGHDGPENMQQLSERIVAIDCALVGETGGLRDGCHQYFRFRDEVVKDVSAVLSGVPATQIQPRETVIPGRRYRITPSGA